MFNLVMDYLNEDDEVAVVTKTTGKNQARPERVMSGEDILNFFYSTVVYERDKRGWRTDKGDAPLKETLAAAMLAASGYSMALEGESAAISRGLPLYDPCCGSGTIAIEAAQIACGIAAGVNRHFGFEKLWCY